MKAKEIVNRDVVNEQLNLRYLHGSLTRNWYRISNIVPEVEVTLPEEERDWEIIKQLARRATDIQQVEQFHNMANTALMQFENQLGDREKVFLNETIAPLAESFYNVCYLLMEKFLQENSEQRRQVINSVAKKVGIGTDDNDVE